MAHIVVPLVHLFMQHDTAPTDGMEQNVLERVPGGRTRIVNAYFRLNLLAPEFGI
jgi:hypothetical protein